MIWYHSCTVLTIMKQPKCNIHFKCCFYIHFCLIFSTEYQLKYDLYMQLCKLQDTELGVDKLTSKVGCGGTNKLHGKWSILVNNAI